MAERGMSHDGPRAESEPDSPRRRGFLVRIALGLSGLLGGLVGIPVLGYLLAPLTNPPQAQWIELGPLDDFPVGETTLQKFTDISALPYAGLTSATAVYVQRPSEAEFTVFAVNCTHLGCPVSWLSSARLFLCPCHGGAYYGDGTVAAGPPPEPLPEYESRVEGGRLYVQTRPLPPSQPWAPPRLPRPREGGGR